MIWHLNWFTKSWWQYLLEKPLNKTKFLCRIKGHPNGPIFYRVDDRILEPDDRCKDCGDHL